VDEKVIGERSLILTQITQALDREEGERDLAEAGGVDHVLLTLHPDQDRDLGSDLGRSHLRFH
jgi:hypothetical protein